LEFISPSQNLGKGMLSLRGCGWEMFEKASQGFDKSFAKAAHQSRAGT